MNLSDTTLYETLQRDTATPTREYWDSCQRKGYTSAKGKLCASLKSQPGVVDAFNPRRYRIYELKFMRYAIRKSKYVDGNGEYRSIEFPTAKDWLHAARDFIWLNGKSLTPSASEYNLYMAVCNVCGIPQDERPMFETDPYDAWGTHLSVKCMYKWRAFMKKRVIPVLETRWGKRNETRLAEIRDTTVHPVFF